MQSRRVPTRAVRALVVAPLVAVAVAAACTPAPSAVPPAAEFLVASADSTYWVTSGRYGVRVRGAPLTLASAGGRYYELFVADDDRSFYNAVLVGQRLYRRDLLTGDSAVVFADSMVPRLAARYAAAHPAESPLAADEEPAAEPEVIANAEVELLAVYGPYATYEYHADIDRSRGGSRYTTRQGVVDWRTGRAVPLTDLFPPHVARAIVAEGRRRFRGAVDTVRRSRDPRAAKARRALAGFAFDERNFSLAAVGGEVAVAFAAPGSGPDAGGLTLPLAPVVASAPPAWWGAVRVALAEPTPEGMLDRWRGQRYRIVARYAHDSVATLALLDEAEREWPVGRVQPPIGRVLWLDRPPVDAPTRRALQRAFDESALYDDNARLTRHPRHRLRGPARHRLASQPGGLSPR